MSNLNKLINQLKLFEEFKTKSQIKFNDRFDFDGTKYIQHNIQITFKCKIHNETINVLPTSHLRSDTGCCKGCLKDKKILIN